MNIATDKDGENVAFGVTVPAPTPSTSLPVLEADCAIIAAKLARELEERGSAAEFGALTVPVPVIPAPGDTYFATQVTAMRAALYLTQSFQEHCCTVLSMTPAGMASQDHHGSEPHVGYVLNVVLNRDVSTLLAQYDALAMPALWTDFAATVYGEAAIKHVMDNARDKLRSLAEDTDDTVH